MKKIVILPLLVNVILFPLFLNFFVSFSFSNLLPNMLIWFILYLDITLTCSTGVKFYEIRKNKAKETFIVNEFITLKLERSKTVIYVGGVAFRQCKYLLLTISSEIIEDYDSIDSVSEILNNELEGMMAPKKLGLTPEEIFKAHCSNLQVWSEWNYDTCLLHSNLAFPLLKRLVEVGDSRAKKAFVEEIVQRYLSGNLSVAEYLRNEGYMDHVSDEELGFLLETQNDKDLINRLIVVTKGIDLEIKAYQRLIELDPINLRNLTLLGLLYEEKQDLTKAIEIYEEIINLYPDNLYTFLNMAYVYYKLSDYSMAIKLYKGVIEKDQKCFEAWNGLYECYVDNDKITESIKVKKRMIELFPENRL